MVDSNISSTFEGIMVPMVTPLLSNGELDKKGVERVVKHLVNGGVQGIFILGTTGEAASLKPAIKKDLIEISCKESNGKTPVFVGITHTSLEVSLKLARSAKENGAVAVVAALPYYFALDQDDIFQYYVKLADQSPLPLFLYNFPVMTKSTIAPETAFKLAKHANIIGLKDSSGNGVYFQKLLQVKQQYPEFSLLVGPEEMLAEAVISGADGGVNGGANIFPSLYVKMYDAAKARDFEKTAKIQSLILEISDGLYSRSPKSSSYLCGVKESMYFMGICEPHLASPLLPVSRSHKEEIILNLEKILLKVRSV